MEAEATLGQKLPDPRVSNNFTEVFGSARSARLPRSPSPHPGPRPAQPRAPLTGAALGPPDLPQEQDHGQEVAQVAEDSEHIHGPARRFPRRVASRGTPRELSGAPSAAAATSPSPRRAVPQAAAAPPRARARALPPPERAHPWPRAVTWRGGRARARSQEAALPTSPGRRAGRVARPLLAYAPLRACIRTQGSPLPSPESTVTAWHLAKSGVPRPKLDWGLGGGSRLSAAVNLLAWNSWEAGLQLTQSLSPVDLDSSALTLLMALGMETG